MARILWRPICLLFLALRERQNLFQNEPNLAFTIAYARELRSAGTSIENCFRRAPNNLRDLLGINACLFRRYAHKGLAQLTIVRSLPNSGFLPVRFVRGPRSTHASFMLIMRWRRDQLRLEPLLSQILSNGSFDRQFHQFQQTGL